MKQKGGYDTDECFKMVQYSPVRIGFDVAQTCVNKAGCGWLADLLIRALVDLALEVDFYLYHQFGTWINSDVSAGTHLSNAHVREPFTSMSPGRARKIWNQVEGAGKSLPGDPDIVHANCFQAPSTGRAKLVYTVYDVSFWAKPEFTTEANRLVCQRGTLEAISRASGLVFISESARKEFEKILPDLCQKRGIETTVALLASRFPYVEKSRQQAPAAEWLAVGSLEPRKNYEHLLDAFEGYWEQSKKKKRLVIAGGSGWKSERLRARIGTMEKNGMVIYLGYVDDTRLWELYKTAFGLIFPSHYEGFGLPIVEAMSQACPVITRKNTSLHEVGGEAAVYYDDTTSDLVQQMLRLEEQSLLYIDLSERALAQARRFSWAKTASKVFELYEQVLPGTLSEGCHQ
jgi:glycosyltransferase involved in cell wall biosynthesis